MAESKNTVVIYIDWIRKFESLEDDEAGRLIKHLFRYVNDLNPKAPDRTTELMFIDIEATLKRDLKKWEKRAERSRENGKLGGRPKNLEEPKKTKQVISKPRKPDSVNDSVNVIDKSINSKTRVVPTSGVDFNKFIEMFNGFVGRKFKINDKIKSALNARVKDYTPKEIKQAIETAHKDPFHVKTNFQYLTPDYILRPNILDKYVNNIGFGDNEPKGYTPQMTN